MREKERSLHGKASSRTQVLEKNREIGSQNRTQFETLAGNWIVRARSYSPNCYALGEEAAPVPAPAGYLPHTERSASG